MFDGTVRKRKDGRYELQITIGYDDDGKILRKSFYGKKEREVIRKKDEWLKENKIKERQNNNHLNNTEVFAVWANQWLEIYKKPVVRSYTYYNTYKIKVDKYLIPHFKQRPLLAITQIDIQKFFNSCQGLAISHQETLRTILRDIFDKAIDNDLCVKNPVKRIKLSSNKNKKEKLAYNAEQQRIAMDWAIKNECYDILTVLKTGIRRGELFGIKWADIDFRAKILNINESISPKTKDGNVDTMVKSNSSRRKIPIDDELLKCLKRLPRNGKYVFVENIEKATNYYPKRLNRYLTLMSEECGIPKLTLHELRHTFGTVLREKGVDIYTISKLLGHSSIAITESIYVHNDIEVLRQAINV